MNALESCFWRFSLALYARPGVAEACLDLQDRRGLDVNLLLYALWRGMEGEALDSAQIRELESLTAPWREAVVGPLREIRRSLKQPLGGVPTPLSAEIRTKVAEIELLAEQIEQSVLFNHASSRAEAVRESASINLAVANAALLMANAPSPQEALDRAALAAFQHALETDL